MSRVQGKRAQQRSRVVILGAAGRDFHTFNVLYRDRPEAQVVAFTATQIPGIDARLYPPELAGRLYPEGIPVVPEADLDELLHREQADEVVFAYSDVSHHTVMKLAARALAAGADFRLPEPRQTMLASKLPVISVCAVRTGCGKSQVTRFLAAELRQRGIRNAVIRHPMPYGHLARQAVQRFVVPEDLAAADCTLEEREEYEPHLNNGSVVYAGADYTRILAAAEQDVELILWDGGNNDFAFVRPDFSIVVVDALRPDQLDDHFPGDAVLLTADLVVVNKTDAATPEQLAILRQGLESLVPEVPVVYGNSPVRMQQPQQLAGRRVLIVEDGPTITHGGMPHGAGYAAVRTVPSAEIVDPRRSASPGVRAIFERYPHIGPVLPAVGYNRDNLADLAATINAADIDLVVAGTPIDLAAAVDIRFPVLRVSYDYQDQPPGLRAALDSFLGRYEF